ncbi:DNA ligase [Candidatus Woesearchaeota archaeon CG10_big_fil_rev_8_21_14_0_10_44_13]|nr:MAG: DNA ligase [Candidatus Woesearchaeota archaeon CG10_big_fil_rev_8_21_14_0_10_44_13]
MRYIELANVYQALESTTKRLEKTHIISEFLKKTDVKDMECIVLLLQGRVFADWDETKIGVASRMVLKAINVATGMSIEDAESEWKRIGDLGNVTQKLVEKKKQKTLFSGELTIKKVFDNIRALATLEGQGSVDRKIQLIAELLASAKPIEARYVIRTVLEDLRVGVASGTLRDAIVWAFFGKEAKLNYNPKEKSIEPEDRERYNRISEAVQNAYDVCNDFGRVAEAAKAKGLKGLELIGLGVGNPIKVMLYQKAKDVADAFERVGKPAAFEYKYDGFRIQAHKKDNKVILYTRRLEEVTKQFPEVVGYVKENVKGREFILDSEAVGYDPKTGRYLPFQSISQRIKRKYDIEKMAKQFPVELNVFDIISFEGRNMMKEPFRKRRELIEKILKQAPKRIVIAKQLITSDPKAAQRFYEESLKMGEEGVMAKNLDGIYKPGSRVGYGVKIKPVMETLDLVIVGAEWGTGKRSGWMSSFVLACRDADTGEFLEIGKVGTGIKELEGSGATFEQLTELLKPLVIDEKGREVRIKPKIVLEINYEEIQKSPSYKSGYALRFPRLVKLRDDKGPDEASELEYVKELFYGQK